MLWSDPALGIDWLVAPEDVVLSDKDRAAPLLADCAPFFRHAGEAVDAT